MNNEQPSTHYSLFVFVQMKIVSLQADDEYSLSVSSKNHLTGETVTKCLRRKIDSPKRQITVYTLFVFCLLFVISLVFRRYLRIVYNGLHRRQVYANVCWNMQISFRATKNCLCVRPETTPLSTDSAECRMKNFFAKRQWTRSTHYSCFVVVSSFHPFFVVVCE